MGICQTVGGAATSGAGISGPEIAFCVRTAIEASGAPAADQTSPSRGDVRVDPEWCTAHETITKSFDDGGGGAHDFTITSYAPKVFSILRRLEGVTDAHVISEFTLPTDSKTQLGEGRSMAMFLKSKNKDYMCKTIALAEVEVLTAILEQYAQHLLKNQHSLLMRFLMLLKIEVRAEVGYILCFGDVFSTCPAINERWDIKGRVPKPGKFLHFPVKEGIATQDLVSARSDAKIHKHDDDKGADEAGFMGQAPAGAPTGSIPTRKDKELLRPFFMEGPRRDELKRQLNDDFTFLCSAGLMDYSVLVGVRYNTNTPRLPQMRHTAHYDVGAPPSGLSFTKPPPVEVRAAAATAPAAECAATPLTVLPSSELHRSRCKYHLGVTSILEEETFYIGIIDMLTFYTGKKKSANFFKTFLWQPETLSTIPPEDYKARISRYIDLILAAPEDPLPPIVD